MNESESDVDILLRKIDELEQKLKDEENYRLEVEDSEANLMEETKALRLLLEHETQSKELLTAENANLKKELKEEVDKFHFQLNHMKKQLIQRVENKSEPTTPKDGNSLKPRSLSISLADGSIVDITRKNSVSTDLKTEVEDLRQNLFEEIQKNEKLQAERDALFSELEDLSRSLFEESNRLVSDEARKCADLTDTIKKQQVEILDMKRRLDVEVEVSNVLKSKLQILSNSSPPVKSSPRRMNRTLTQESIVLFESEFESQLQKLENQSLPPAPNGLVTEIHKKLDPVHKSSSGYLQVPVRKSSSEDDSGVDPNKLILLLPDEIHSGDLKDFEEFVAMKQSPSNSVSKLLFGEFGERVYECDLVPCLKFQRKEKSFQKKVNKIKFKDLDIALIDNKCFIEPLNSSELMTGSKEHLLQTCSLCIRDWPCKYRMYLESSLTVTTSNTATPPKQWKYLCNYCRNRIVSVADFYTFIRNVKMGIFKTPITSMYKECLRLRIRMNVSRLISG